MATIKPPHGKQSKVVWLDDLIVLNLKRQAIESPEGNVKNYMESIITCFAMSTELQRLYQLVKKDQEDRVKWLELNADKLRDLQQNS